MRFLYIVFVFSFLTTSQLSAGGGWPQPKGKGYFKLSEWWLISDQHYTDQGRIDPNITTGLFNTSLYAEYGLSDRITAILYFPIFSRSYNNNIVSGTTGEIITAGESIGGIGDTEVTIKYGLTRPGSGLSVAASLTFGLPVGNDSGGSQKNLQTGDGEFNQLISLDAGTGWQFGEIPLYANVGVGFNNRTNDFSDELRYNCEIGANLFNKKLWVIAKLNGVESLRNGATAANTNASSLFANNSEYLSIGGELAYNINDKWGVTVGAMNALSGKIIFASPSYSVGVFTRI